MSELSGYRDSLSLLEDDYNYKLQRLQNHYASLWIEIPDEEYESLRSNFVIERTVLETNSTINEPSNRD